MTKREIVERLAYLGRVEEIIRNVAHTSRLAPDLADLAQLVYIALLNTPEERILDLWENDELYYYVTRIILNQYRSKNSPWRRTYHGKVAHAANIDDLLEKL